MGTFLRDLERCVQSPTLYLRIVSEYTTVLGLKYLLVKSLGMTPFLQRDNLLLTENRAGIIAFYQFRLRREHLG